VSEGTKHIIFDDVNKALVSIRNQLIKSNGEKKSCVVLKKNKIFLALVLQHNSCGMPGHIV
jgi:hypothetical protein